MTTGGCRRRQRLSYLANPARSIARRDPRTRPHRPAGLRQRRRGPGRADRRPPRRHRRPHRAAPRGDPGGRAQPGQGAAGRRCPTSVLTLDAAGVVVDPDVDVVVEVIGGIEPARELVLAALKAGKPVVTGNKELLANVGADLFAAAEEAGVDLLFEAAVAGGIPFIRPLRESLAGERIDRIMGIVNGTTNYILTRMTEAGRVLRRRPQRGPEPRLRRARPHGRRRGPRRRGQGRDHRLDRLRGPGRGRRRLRRGHLRHHAPTDIDVRRQDGLRGQAAGHRRAARRRRGDGHGGEVAVRVHPAMVPADHPLASVRDSFNAVFVEGAAVGDLMFYGRGAGGGPTASAVLGDVIDAALNRTQGQPRHHRRRWPRPASGRSTRSRPPTTSTSTSSTGPACWPRWRACSATTTCRSARWSRRAWAARPGSCSSPTSPARPPSRPRSATSTTSTRSTASPRCCGSSARVGRPP